MPATYSAGDCYSGLITAAVAEWVRTWDTLPMFEATVCRRS